MKQAILIMAHNNLEQLKILLKLLDNINFDIFIHLDKKCTFTKNELSFLCNKSNLFVYTQFDIKWAEYSQTECEIFLLKKGLSQNNYEYFHLISGFDMPLKTSNQIYDFFHNRKEEFVHIESNYIKDYKLNYIKYSHPLLRCKRFRKNHVLIILDKLLILFQKIIGVNNLKNFDGTFYTGANWFSITNNFANYIVSKEKMIYKLFSKSKSSDEFFVQTLLMNSEFKNKIYYSNMDDNYIACMRYIDWKRGNPYVWKSSEFKVLMDSPYMFARKFDWNQDKEIILKLSDHLKS